MLPDSYTWLQLPEQFDEKLKLHALKLTWYLDKRRDGPATGELVVRTANPAQDLRHVSRLVMERLNQQALPAPVHSIRWQSLRAAFTIRWWRLPSCGPARFRVAWCTRI